MMVREDRKVLGPERARRSARRLRRLGGAVGISIAVALLMSACGSNSSDSTNTTSSSANAPKGTPVKIALLVDVTGQLNGGQGTSIAPVLDAWAKATNDAGGVAGHPVSIVVKDTKDNPSTAAADAQQVVADKSVLGVVLVDAIADAAAARVLSAAGLPVIGGNGFNPAVWGAVNGNRLARIPQMRDVFGVVTAFPANAAPFFSAAQKAGLRDIAAIDFAQDPSSKHATELIAGMSRAVGMNFLAGITVDATAPNFTAQCLQLVQKHVEYTVLTMPDSTAKRIAADCKTQGYRGTYGASAALVTPLFYDSVTDTRLIGGLTGFPWFVDAAPVKRYRQVMADNGVAADKWGRGDSTASWASVELFKKALEANARRLGSTITRERVLDAYYTIKNETLGGLLPGPVTYTKGQPAPAPRCAWLYTYENGRFTGSFTPTCPDPRMGLG
jgi:branched-chain amino acid transport system substrate-binding protein